MARRKAAVRRVAPAGAKANGGGGESAKAGPSQGAAAVDAASLIEKAHTLLAQSNFSLAIKFLGRAITLEPQNLEARELLGVAELEGGDADAGREHLLHLFPPHTPSPPTTASPYLYLAQSAPEPQEALGYYSTAAAMIERNLTAKGKMKASSPGRSAAGEGEEEGWVEQRAMAVRALVAMIEIWMSDLCMEDAAEANCDALILRAMSISPGDPEVRLSLASIRMSQSRFDEAKSVVLELYHEIEGKESFDESLPGLPARLALARLMLEHSLHLEALELLATAREEDELAVEAAYLEGWAWHLRGEALLEDPSLLQSPRSTSVAANGDRTAPIPVPPPEQEEREQGQEEEQEDGPETFSASECFTESLRALLETAQMWDAQEYPDEGIAAHVQELLAGLQERGVKPPPLADEGEEGGWEDVDEDVDMA